MIHGNFEVLQLGLQDYQDTFEAMKRFTQNRNASTKDQLWVVEMGTGLAYVKTIVP